MYVRACTHKRGVVVVQAIMKGSLKKKSPKGILRKYWQTRYFMLFDDSLIYFRKITDLVPAGECMSVCTCMYVYVCVCMCVGVCM